MTDPIEIFSDILRSHNLKISHQRIRLLQYLSENFAHPSADRILNDLLVELPTLSKSTVYKTLNAFVDAGLLREITIEDNEIRYEYNLKDHGHFKCLRCGTVYDFDLDTDEIRGKQLDGFLIQDQNVYLKGICKCCNTQKA